MPPRRSSKKDSPAKLAGRMKRRWRVVPFRGGGMMALTMRPSGLGSGIDKDRPDYTVYCGGWDVGRIYETRRSQQSAQVLVAKRQRSNDALGSGGDPRRGEGAVSEKLGRLEGVGEAGRS